MNKLTLLFLGVIFFLLNILTGGFILSKASESSPLLKSALFCWIGGMFAPPLWHVTIPFLKKTILIYGVSYDDAILALIMASLVKKMYNWRKDEDMTYLRFFGVILGAWLLIKITSSYLLTLAGGTCLAFIYTTNQLFNPLYEALVVFTPIAILKGWLKWRR